MESSSLGTEFLNSTNALFDILQTSSAWPLSLPVYDPAWGCACESAEDRPVWLAALDLCFWVDSVNETQRGVLFGGSEQLQQAYERACTAFAPGEQVNEYYHHVRLCATPAFVREIYFLASKEYCVPEEANSFQLYPRLARDGAMMCGTDIGPVGPTQSNEEADCPCNIFFDYDALTNSSSTALDTVSTFYAVVSQPNSSWPVRRPRTRDGECACDDPEFRPVWLAPIDMCDYYARQPPEVQALLLPPGDPAAQAVFERACLGLSREEQNRDFMHVKFCADRAFITDIFYEHDYCQRPDESGQLIPLTAPDGLLFCQGLIPSPSPPPSTSDSSIHVTAAASRPAYESYARPFIGTISSPEARSKLFVVLCRNASTYSRADDRESRPALCTTESAREGGLVPRTQSAA